MSISRPPASQVRSYSITHPPGRVALPTQDGWDYLVFAHTGLFTALTDGQAWTVPAHRLLVVRTGTRIRIDTPRRVAIRCLYLRSDLDVVGDDLRVVNVSPLLRALLLHAVERAPTDLTASSDQATITLLADQLTSAPVDRLHLPLPHDPAANAVAASIMHAPADRLEQHLVGANASRRTIERHFASDTQLSLGQWRRRARILASLTMLADGDSITNVALAVGYASASSFVYAFRSELDSTPRAFMQSKQSPDVGAGADGVEQ